MVLKTRAFRGSKRLWSFYVRSPRSSLPRHQQQRREGQSEQSTTFQLPILGLLVDQPQ